MSLPNKDKIYLLVGYYNYYSSNIPNVLIFGIYNSLDSCLQQQDNICGIDNIKDDLYKTVKSQWNGSYQLITWIKIANMGEIDKPIYLSNTRDV